ncbi:MAG: hypothetical protein AB1426_12690 [Bacillota bacterium]
MKQIKEALDRFGAEIRAALKKLERRLKKFERSLKRWMLIFSVGYVIVMAAVLSLFYRAVYRGLSTLD